MHGFRVPTLTHCRRCHKTLEDSLAALGKPANNLCKECYNRSLDRGIQG